MAQYNPNIHHRRSIRLKGYDYTKAGLYFVTICCQDMIARFGSVRNREMQLNDLGQVAFDEWTKLPERYPYLDLDVFQIMPNHIHAILFLHNNVVQASLAGATTATALGDIVGGYKSLVLKGCLAIIKSKKEGKDAPSFMGRLWQRNFYESIIRNEEAYKRIASYIINNPYKWKDDEYHCAY